MPAIGNIIITDGQPTPVSRTFSPVGINSDLVATYENRSGGIPVGYDSLSIGLRRPSKTNRNYKATVRLALPTLEVTAPSTTTGIQPAPSRAYDCVAFLEFVLPERCTLQERKNLLALIRNALATTGVIESVVQNLETVY